MTDELEHLVPKLHGQVKNGSYTGIDDAPDACENGSRVGLSSPKDGSGHHSTAKLGLLTFTVLVYYEVSGGPFGVEDIVRAGGPFYALVGFLLILVWSVPEAMITAEMASALPESSGAVAWVDVAFGEFWAFQRGWLSVVSGIADNALYPILFLDCLNELVTESNSCCTSSAECPCPASNLAMRGVLAVLITILLTYVNYRGVDVVAKTSVSVCIFTLLPFVVFCVVGAFKVDPQRWLDAPKGGFREVDWPLLLNTFFWNVNYWESAATFGGITENPSRNFPLGLFLAIVMVVCFLLFPVLIGTGASKAPYSEWTDGYFVELGKEIVGPWFGYWLILSSAVSNVGMFEAEMSSDSWQIAGMADRGILPAVLSTRSKYNTPQYGIMISATGVLCLAWLSFTEIISMLNIMFCVGQIIEFAAFIYLRVERSDIHRPFRLPLNTFGVCAMLTLPSLFILAIFYFSPRLSIVSAFLMCVLGVVVHFVLQYAREYKWCRFHDR